MFAGVQRHPLCRETAGMLHRGALSGVPNRAMWRRAFGLPVFYLPCIRAIGTISGNWNRPAPIMMRQDETIFTVHGLDADMGVVHAEVFTQKLRELMGALRTADKLANGGKAHDYLLPELMKGSAAVTVRERPRKRKAVESSIAYFHQAAVAVYRGDRRSAPSLDPEFVRKIEKLSSGVSERFAHAEIGFSDNNVIRIDDYFRSRAKDALLIRTNFSPDETQSY